MMLYPLYQSRERAWPASFNSLCSAVIRRCPRSAAKSAAERGQIALELLAFAILVLPIDDFALQSTEAFVEPDVHDACDGIGAPRGGRPAGHDLDALHDAGRQQTEIDIAVQC